jgi:hypothetical protein
MDFLVIYPTIIEVIATGIGRTCDRSTSLVLREKSRMPILTKTRINAIPPRILSLGFQFKCEQFGMTFGSQGELQTHSNKEHVGTA